MNTILKHGLPPYKTALIHGGPGAAGEMAPVAQELSKYVGVLEPFQTASSVQGQLKELYLQLKGIPQFVLIGHSWGAWLAYLYASKYPERIKKLILIGSAPFESQYAEKIIETRINRLLPNERVTFKHLLEQLNNLKCVDCNQVFEKIGELLNKADTYQSIGKDETKIDFQYHIFEKVWKEAHNLRKTGALLSYGKRIKCPVVAIHGDYDTHPEEGVRKPLKQLIKNFTFVLLKKCGHYPWNELHARDQFYEILKRHII